MSTRSSKDKTVYEQKVTARGEHYYKPYHIGKMLGKGGFATCYEVKHPNDDTKYAIKVIKKQSQNQNNKLENIEKIKEEIALISSLDHPGIVKYIHHFQDNQNFYIIFQLCVNGSLTDILKKRKILSQPQIRYFLLQMIDIIKYIKHKNIIHRDIKLANYFLDDKYRLKLGDFGLATKNNDFFRSKKKVCGTPNYIAPEILEKKVYGFEVDVWSTGVLLFTLALGVPPFETKNCKQTYDKIKKCIYRFDGISKNVSCSDELKDLIRRILCLDPIKRMKIEDFMNHPFMSRFHIPPELEVTFPASSPSGAFLKTYSRIKRKKEGCSLKKQHSSLAVKEEVKIQYKAPKVTYKDALYSQQMIEQNIIKETQYMFPVKKEYEKAKVEFNVMFDTPKKAERKDELKIEAGLEEGEKQQKEQFEETQQQYCLTGRKKFCSRFQPDPEPENQTQKKVKQKEKSLPRELPKPQVEKQPQEAQIYQQNKQPSQAPIVKQQVLPPANISQPPVQLAWNRPTICLKLKRTIKKKTPTQPHIKIIHWLNVIQRYGIVYILSNHEIGFYFNDSSRMLLSSLDKTIHYLYKKDQQTNHRQIDITQIKSLQTDKLYKKIEILLYYQKILRAKYPIKSTNIPKGESIHLKGYKMGNQLTVFKFSNNDIQFFFQDSSDILLSFADQSILYQSKRGLMITDFLLSEKVHFDPEFVKKIQIVFSFYGKWLPKQQAGTISESDRVDKYIE